MNKKSLNKKLVLGKQTIANLMNSEMHRIAGGTQQGETTDTIQDTHTLTNCFPCSNTFCGWATCVTCTTCFVTCPC